MAVGRAETRGDTVRAPISARSRAVILSQLPLTGVVALVALGIAIFDPVLFESSSLVAGIIAVFVLSGVALVVPWERVNPWWMVSIPVLDIGAIGLMRVEGDAIRLSVLLVFPVVWLASRFRGPGVAIGVVLSTIAAWGTSVVDVGSLNLSDASRVLLLPLVLTFLAATTAAMSSRSAAHRSMLARQGRLVEEALANAKQQRRVLGGILNAVDFGIIGVFGDGRLTAINTQSLTLLRVEEPDADTLVFYGADRSTPVGAHEHPIARARAGENFQMLVWRGAPGEEQAALSVTSQQLYDDSGARTGAIVVFQDVTHEVEALRSRDDLVAAVSHELRTPLTSIVGYLELIDGEDSLSPQAEEFVRVASQNADRLLRIVSDLLTAASTSDGKLSVVPTASDLAPIVASSVQALRPRADQRGITIDNRVGGHQEAYVDELRMRQVIDNVLSNAVKYGKDDGTVTIELVAGENELQLVVVDDGIGMSSADQARLFDRFFRAPAVRSTSIHGTGLGLNISRAIMQQHGGDIRVSSELGVGTRVAIVIPRP